MQYAAVSKESPAIRPDGMYVQLVMLTVLPTLRGSVRLTSWSPQDIPLIDSNLDATEADCHNMRESLTKAQQMFLDTAAGQLMIVK